MEPKELADKITRHRPLVSSGITAGGWVECRVVATIRLFIVSLILFLVCTTGVGNSDQNPFVASVLLLYTMYSVALYFLALHHASALPVGWLHWIDLTFCSLLMALNGGTDSAFSFLLFLPVAIASFRWGFGEGFRVLITALLAYCAASYLAGPDGYPLQLDRFLLRFMLLGVLGTMIVYWGTSEITFKRRLNFLKESTQMANPRFGIDRTIALLLDKMRDFYDANSCILIHLEDNGAGYQLRHARRDQPVTAQSVESLPPELKDLLLSPRQNVAMVYGMELPWSRVASSHEFDVTTHDSLPSSPEGHRLAALLEAESLLSVPVWCHHTAVGRLILTSDKRHHFNEADADFVLQFIDQVAPGIENIRLLDHMVSEAAEEERRKLALDIHDSVIQPSIGVQIGLSDIYQKIGGEPEVKEKIGRLIEANSNGIATLRHYMNGLREAPHSPNGKGDGLLAAVERFAAKFKDTAHIDVEIESNLESPINDRLAAEAFQMVVEGLSNIRRHTNTDKAFLRIFCNQNHFDLYIENAGNGCTESVPVGTSQRSSAREKAGAEKAGAQQSGKGKTAVPFTPRSLMARAASLGGHARVKMRDDGGAVVIIHIPL